jgi:thiol-disulfide isomerase/thioredoxin
MGKASRSKRERREQDEVASAKGAPLPSLARHEEKQQLPIFWIVVGLLVAGALGGVLLFGPSDDEKARVSAASDAPVAEEVIVDGDPLPKWRGADVDDPAVGEAPPRITGTDLTGATRALIEPGRPTAVVVVAHWCPHCQDEVPRIVEWSNGDTVPENVDVIALSTQANEGQSNFPPAEWLAREEWPFETMVDDEVGSGADALGIDGFPFLVFIGADGTVTERYSGEMPIKEFDAAVQKLAKTTEPEAAGS